MKTLCPICSSILLRQFGRGEIAWFCLRCYQEMPNLNLIKLNSIQKKTRAYHQYLKHHEYRNIDSSVKHAYQVIEYQSSTIDLFVNQNKKRLEVIEFILNKIDVLLVNTFIEPKKYSNVELIGSSRSVKHQAIKVTASIKSKFLIDSELILLRICQAILVADQSILKKIVRQEININYVNFKFQIAKIYFVDLIKTIVIEHLKSIALESSQNIDCFISEVAGYFELAVSLMLHPGLKVDIWQN